MRNAGNPYAKKGVKYNKGEFDNSWNNSQVDIQNPIWNFLDSVKNSYLVSVILSTIHCT